MTDKNQSEITHAIDELWNEYSLNTDSLSKVCRQLAFAEGGLCWFFKTPQSTFPSQIINVLFFLILYFLLDAFQYLISAVLYKNLAKYYEKRNENNLLKNKNDVKRPACINFPAKICFILKIVSLSYASLLLIKYFINIQLINFCL